MITDQIINYIKDQINRGVSRDKIRSNLVSAGWEESDINQAFSFAEPNGQPAVLKIAPSFAVADEVEKEKSIDKTSLTKNDQPFIPALKNDTPATVNPTYNPVRPADEKIMTMQSSAPNTTMQNTTKPIDDSLNQMGQKPKESILVVRNPNNNVIKNFGDEGEIKKPKASGILKSLTIFLVLVLLIGNGFLWFYVFPRMDAKTKNTINNQKQNNNLNQQVREVVKDNPNVDTNPNDTNSSVNPVEALKNPTNTFKTYTTNYFTKNNSYGTTPMLLSSCNVPSTVFADVNVKKTLDQISAISKGLPYCSLATDDTTKKNRMTSYLVYLPMENGGYCIDSTGASLVVTKKPTGTSCVTAL